MKNTGEESWKQIVREKQSSKESCEEEKKKKKTQQFWCFTF